MRFAAPYTTLPDLHRRRSGSCRATQRSSPVGRRWVHACRLCAVWRRNRRTSGPDRARSITISCHRRRRRRRTRVGSRPSNPLATSSSRWAWSVCIPMGTRWSARLEIDRMNHWSCGGVPSPSEELLSRLRIYAKDCLGLGRRNPCPDVCHVSLLATCNGSSRMASSLRSDRAPTRAGIRIFGQRTEMAATSNMGVGMIAVVALKTRCALPARDCAAP